MISARTALHHWLQVRSGCGIQKEAFVPGSLPLQGTPSKQGHGTVAAGEQVALQLSCT
jgi:hypothetical protein